LLLLGDGIETIGLNVNRDNAAAVRAYTRLGFEPVAEYVEASLVA
jgi:predicted GNAT family acetyltransferase